jgi:Lrp/AsnC family transcriptional regulator, leucine-responsive regulatory protein
MRNVRHDRGVSEHDPTPPRRTSTLDDIDRQLLDLLRHDARIPVSELARAVNLSPAPVSRRIDRLERDGVIKGYVTVVDDLWPRQQRRAVSGCRA